MARYQGVRGARVGNSRSRQKRTYGGPPDKVARLLPVRNRQVAGASFPQPQCRRNADLQAALSAPNRRLKHKPLTLNSIHA